MGRGLTRTISTVPVTGSGAIEVDGLAQHMLLGVQLTENAGTAGVARVLLRNGVGGAIYIDVRLGPTEAMEESYTMDSYYYFSNGIYLDVVQGTIRGSVRCRRSP